MFVGMRRRRWSWQSWVIWGEGREGRPSTAERQTVLEKMWGMWYKLPPLLPSKVNNYSLFPVFSCELTLWGNSKLEMAHVPKETWAKQSTATKSIAGSTWLCESTPRVPGWSAHPISNCPKMLLLPSEICKACWAVRCLLSILWQCLSGILTMTPAVVGSAKLGQGLKCPYKLNYK